MKQNIRQFAFLLALAVALCASAAYAAAANPSALSQTTDDGVTTIITTGRAQADITLNSDGSLTLEEYKTGMKDKQLENADKRFKKSDSNGDGKLSFDEFKAGMPKPKE